MSNPLIPPDDAFLGTWQLVPEQSGYEMGQPPQTGLYRLATTGDQYQFEIEWTDANGQALSIAFDGIPDGQQYPIDSPAADAVCFTRVDTFTLDSASFKDGQRSAYARRVLSADAQTMTVSQSGVTPAGAPFTNNSVYVRQA